MFGLFSFHLQKEQERFYIERGYILSTQNMSLCQPQCIVMLTFHQPQCLSSVMLLWPMSVNTYSHASKSSGKLSQKCGCYNNNKEGGFIYNHMFKKLLQYGCDWSGVHKCFAAYTAVLFFSISIYFFIISLFDTISHN